jgi:hypothetical protein
MPTPSIYGTVMALADPWGHQEILIGT